MSGAVTTVAEFASLDAIDVELGASSVVRVPGATTAIALSKSGGHGCDAEVVTEETVGGAAEVDAVSVVVVVWRVELGDGEAVGESLAEFEVPQAVSIRVGKACLKGAWRFF